MADDYFTLQTMIGRAFRIHPPQTAGAVGKEMTEPVSSLTFEILKNGRQVPLIAIAATQVSSAEIIRIIRQPFL